MVDRNAGVFLSSRLHLKAYVCFAYLVVSTELKPVDCNVLDVILAQRWWR
jgi:hypothetical protein